VRHGTDAANLRAMKARQGLFLLSFAGLSACGKEIPTIDGIVCTDGDAQSMHTAVFTEYVVDGSESMNQDRKRATQEVGLLDIVRDAEFRAAVPGQVVEGVGMIYFGAAESYPDAKDVAPRFVDEEQLANLTARLKAFPSGLTRTYEALQGGFRVLDKLVPAQPLPKSGKKIAVLMTDGMPVGGTAELLALVRQKAQQADPIATYAIAVGDTEDGVDALMSAVAVAGGTDLPNCDKSARDSSNFCHRHVMASVPEYLAALNTIRVDVGSCDYDIELKDKYGGQADPSKVHVKFSDGEANFVRTIANDAVDGWTFDDVTTPRHLKLHGAACLESKVKRWNLTVSLGCAKSTAR